jgi:thiamine biosynthesis lipoprotein
MASSRAGGYRTRDAGTHWAITYQAMASPCEVLVRCKNVSEARELASLAFVETTRIEDKFSRYRDDNVVYQINHGDGESVPVDEETMRLLRYAGQCYELSGGLFDITSGILRRAWAFNGDTVRPDEEQIASLLDRVGWERVQLDDGAVRLARGMEIDLGGIGKEYAADRVADLVARASGVAVLVNLGGDIRAIAGGKKRRPWTVGIEAPGEDEVAVGEIKISEGGVATSGDTRRFCIVDGRRLCHILDPRTGWPVAGAPKSVTVVADNCTAAGFLATMAMLHGPDAATFLKAQNVTHHVTAA